MRYAMLPLRALDAMLMLRLMPCRALFRRCHRFRLPRHGFDALPLRC